MNWVDVIDHVNFTKGKTKAQLRMDEKSGSWVVAELILKPRCSVF